MPNVSVIFPMYNVAEYLTDSLTSVLNQTYRDFELIAVNDGSTDSTAEIFEQVIREKNDGIEISLIQKENGGLADARNAGLKHAKGEWVVFIDSDDVMHPDYLKTLLSDAETYHTDLSMASFKRVTKETLFDFEKTVAGERMEQEKVMKLLFSRRSFETGCWCLLIKKSLLDKNHVSFNKNVKFSVDQAFIWKVTDLACCISLNPSRIYQYYIREGSIMTSTKKENLLSGAEYFESVARTLEHLPFDSEQLINRWKIGILHSTAKLTSYEDYREVRIKLAVRYGECIKIPVPHIRALSLIGLISERWLYRIFSKY